MKQQLSVATVVSSKGNVSLQVVPRRAPVHVRPEEGAELRRLMDAQVHLQDKVYSQQLDATLQRSRAPGGGAKLPEEALPTQPYIPACFRGKSWAQIQQEDEEKVEKLVRQFRRDTFICYFDSESLARSAHLPRPPQVFSRASSAG